MLTTRSGPLPGARHPQDASRAAALLTSRLTEAGLICRTQDDGYGHGLHVTVLNAAHARSLLTAGHNGIIRWHYEPCTGPVTEPAAITHLVSHLLGAPASRPPSDNYRTFLLKGAAGRQLQDLGLAVTLLVDQDLESFDVTAHIQITNPAQPERGTVQVSDLADIEWDYPYRDNPATCAANLAGTVIPILRDGISTRTR